MERIPKMITLGNQVIVLIFQILLKDTGKDDLFIQVITLILLQKSLSDKRKLLHTNLKIIQLKGKRNNNSSVKQ
jgi:hypothetical protein